MKVVGHTHTCSCVHSRTLLHIRTFKVLKRQTAVKVFKDPPERDDEDIPSDEDDSDDDEGRVEEVQVRSPYGSTCVQVLV